MFIYMFLLKKICGQESHTGQLDFCNWLAYSSTNMFLLVFLILCVCVCVCVILWLSSRLYAVSSSFIYPTIILSRLSSISYTTEEKHKNIKIKGPFSVTALLPIPRILINSDNILFIPRFKFIKLSFSPIDSIKLN